MSGNPISLLNIFKSDDFPVLKRLVSENFRRFAPQYSMAMVLMAIVATTTGLSAWLMKDLINKVFVDRDPCYMWVICGSVIVIYTPLRSACACSTS